MDPEPLSTQLIPKHAIDDAAQPLVDLINEYSDLYAETKQSMSNYFELLMLDKKPGISIEIYNKPKERVDEFRSKLERYFFVYGDYKINGDYSSYHLAVSKIGSIARCIDIIEREGFASSAGAVGLLLGFQMNEVIDYIKRTKEDSIKT